MRRLIGIAIAVGISWVLASCSSTGAMPDRPIETAPEGRPAVEEAEVDGSGDVVLRIRSVGPVDADETLITIHGGPGLSLETMDRYASLAGTDRRVVSYDQRGSGSSSVPDDLDYTLDAQVADLEAVRIALGSERLQLLGQSWGGAIAAAYAAMHPDRVSALVLVGAVPLDRAEFLAGQRRFQVRVGELQELGIIGDVLPSIEEGSCTSAFSAVLPAYLDDPNSEVSMEIVSCSAATSRATYEAFIGDEAVAVYAKQLAAYRSPTLLVAGRHDAFGSDWLERHRDLLAGAPTETAIIADAGHLVIAEQPDATLAAIALFLDEGPGSP